MADQEDFGFGRIQQAVSMIEHCRKVPSQDGKMVFAAVARKIVRDGRACLGWQSAKETFVQAFIAPDGRHGGV
jgi:hypothetical protein